MTYRTPDVYVEEISVFPPSVAEVETAIPAFIGFTEKAKREEQDLWSIPTRITSLLEYQELFGVPSTPNVTKIILDENSNFKSAEITPSNYLYDSLRLFFDNGGGPCYIVAVGDYDDNLPEADANKSRKDKLLAGLDKIKRVDEPTILLFPDAAALPEDELAAVQQKALAQCGDLCDRVALLDTHFYDDKTSSHATEIDSFRGKLGINSLKYGAAYAPWVKVNYAKNIGYADIKEPDGKIKGIQVKLSSLTGEQKIKDRIDWLDKAWNDKNAIKDYTGYLAQKNSSSATTVPQHWDQLLKNYASSDDDSAPAEMQNMFGYVMDIVKTIDAMVGGLKTFTIENNQVEPLTLEFAPDPKFPTKVEGVLPSIKAQIGELITTIRDFISLERELAGVLNGPTPSSPPTYVEQWSKAHTPSADEWKKSFTDNKPDATTDTITGKTKDKLNSAKPRLNAAFLAVSNALVRIAEEAEHWRKEHERFLYENFPVYRNIIKGVNSTLTCCPPSGAIAGIYALVDNTRGVWKAPANVSLNGVVEPVYHFDKTETDNLNVDATTGKSINAIRAFSGKGTLVWGARTLTGNDNEWRYVSVRRFFNMVEESVKKSTYWAVFEPNNANTWVKVRGMIENYLTQKWREGALAGATTKDAFYVRCGLGVTMTAQEILDGYMNVEIGMAVVRPAEFIVLKFSHKQQTS